MKKILAGKKILLGVTGSIAAYKSAEYLRHLRKAGAEVTVIMTESAKKFVTPLTFEALSGNRVFSEMFDVQDAESIPHISLGQDHDLVIIAPTTAQTISRLAHGLADDLLSAVLLAAECPVMICPAMNSRMYLHPATQENIKRLKTFGYQIIEPDSGEMACGDLGPGRLPEWQVVQESILALFTVQDLMGKTILISAGPTEEPLDPVRFLSNRSTGKMGYALARIASIRGANVILVSGPTSLPPPLWGERIIVRTALEMQEEIENNFLKADIIIMAAAVSDFRPSQYHSDKIKKGPKDCQLALTANPDILKTLGNKVPTNNPRPILVGFAAESSRHLAEGSRKLQEKQLDMIIINDIIGQDTGFAGETNKVTIISKNGTKLELPLLSKEETSMAIFDNILPLSSLN